MRVLRRTRGRRTWMHTSVEDAMDGLGTEASVCARAHTHTHTHTHDGFRSHRGSSDGGKAPSCFVSAFQSGPRLSLARPCASCMSACGACVRVRGGEHAVCAKPCVYPCFAHWHAGSRACFDPCRHARARGCGMRARTICVRANVCAVAMQTARRDCCTRTRSTWPCP